MGTRCWWQLNSPSLEQNRSAISVSVGRFCKDLKIIIGFDLALSSLLMGLPMVSGLCTSLPSPCPRAPGEQNRAQVLSAEAEGGDRYFLLPASAPTGCCRSVLGTSSIAPFGSQEGRSTLSPRCGLQKSSVPRGPFPASSHQPGGGGTCAVTGPDDSRASPDGPETGG